jgi:hypothetical protein
MMGLFKKFKAPKGKIELRLDEVSYEATDKLTGQILLDPEEDISVDEFRIEFDAKKKVKWKKGFSSYNATSSLETKKKSVGGSVKLAKGQHHEQPFNMDIPQHSRPDPFTELEVTVKGVAAVQDRPDLTSDVKPVINFLYVTECPRQYGGCGFTSQPSTEPVKTCPKCGHNLEEAWNRKYSDESRRAAQGSRRF